MSPEQQIMFPEAEVITVADRKPINSSSTLMACALAYRKHMEEIGFSTHTVKAFFGDLRLAQNYFSPETPIYELGTQELNQFLYWLQYERNVPCSPKSYARRVTTLKSFFSWLTSIKITPFDPASALLHQRVTTPLPIILQNSEVDRLLETTEALSTTATKPDPRPHLLATLLLQTGMKKAECMRLTADDFEESDPKAPTILIRYQDPRLLHKERRLEVGTDLLKTLDRYLEVYKSTEHIFACTPRNLEYVLTDAAQLAQLPNGASFESLRWTCAFRDYRDGMSLDKLQLKLGLSKVTFRETLRKLEKLAAGETSE